MNFFALRTFLPKPSFDWSKVVRTPSFLSEELIELWDDCMSFPNLLVRLKRHKTCTVHFRDENWTPQIWKLEDNLSEKKKTIDSAEPVSIAN